MNTPAVQTNFSPASRAYWTQVYLDIAKLQNQAGLVPYLQSGEVQWWYFPKTGVGMPFYDAYSQSQFLAEYGVPMQTILTNDGDPADYPNEVVFLPGLIASHTAAIRGALQSQFPNCRFEVLYPTDTNSTAFNTLINFAATDWTPQNLDCLKTECFGFTGGRDLVNAGSSISFPATKGFPNTQRSHLVAASARHLDALDERGRYLTVAGSGIGRPLRPRSVLFNRLSTAAPLSRSSELFARDKRREWVIWSIHDLHRYHLACRSASLRHYCLQNYPGKKQNRFSCCWKNPKLAGACFHALVVVDRRRQPACRR